MSGRLSSKPPDKGSFPLDHFHECDKQAQLYTDCLKKHHLMPKRCRKFQIDYLQCRMESGLMEKEEFDKLGFTEEISWESEDSEKQALFEKIAKLRAKAAENYKLREEFKQKQAEHHEKTNKKE